MRGGTLVLVGSNSPRPSFSLSSVTSDPRRCASASSLCLWACRQAGGGGGGGALVAQPFEVPRKRRLPDSLRYHPPLSAAAAKAPSPPRSPTFDSPPPPATDLCCRQALRLSHRLLLCDPELLRLCQQLLLQRRDLRKRSCCCSEAMLRPLLLLRIPQGLKERRDLSYTGQRPQLHTRQ